MISIRRLTTRSAMLLTLSLFATQICQAEQRLDLEGTAIFGNKESPNVLYVVPWRSAKRLTGMMPPETGRREELLSPLDRDVFRRQIDWYQRYGE
ncbi:MAG: hypothetical protein ABW105_20685 [Candidatus Thiodiazotropha sp. 6PLUC1]